MKKSSLSKATPYFLTILSGLLILCAYSVNTLGWIVWFSYCPLLYVLYKYPKKWIEAFIYIVVAFEIGIGTYLVLISIQSWMIYFALIFPIILALITSFVWKLSCKFNIISKALLGATYVASLDLLIALTPITAVMSPALCLGGMSVFLSPVSLFGFPYLSLLIILFNSLLTMIVSSIIEKTPFPKLNGIIIMLVIMVSFVLPMILPLKHDKTIEVAALDAGMKPGGFHNPPEELKEEREKLENLEGKYADLIREAADREADFIIMSEKFFPTDPFADDELKEQIVSFVNDLDSVLIVTAVSDNKNIAVPVVANEGFGRIYEKVKIADIMGEIQQAGSELPVYESEWGTYGLLICYDMHYEENIRSLVDSGAGMVAVASNANSYTNSKAWVERTASLRAAENHVPFVISTDIGSYIVNSNGKVIESTGGEPSYSYTELQLSSSKTIYRLFGYKLRWLIVTAFVFISTLSIFKKK